MSARDRRLIRYGVACMVVVAGGICAAALTNTLGNTLATVMIGGGLLAIVIFLLRDMGLVAASEPKPPQPSRNGSDPHDRATTDSDARHPGRQARRSVNVRRPDRMRGQRRRLR